VPVRRRRVWSRGTGRDGVGRGGYELASQHATAVLDRRPLHARLCPPSVGGIDTEGSEDGDRGTQRSDRREGHRQMVDIEQFMGTSDDDGESGGIGQRNDVRPDDAPQAQVLLDDHPVVKMAASSPPVIADPRP
jgi:hypothetical protein